MYAMPDDKPWKTSAEFEKAMQKLKDLHQGRKHLSLLTELVESGMWGLFKRVLGQMPVDFLEVFRQWILCDQAPSKGAERANRALLAVVDRAIEQSRRRRR
jgi:hypothetical protein